MDCDYDIIITTHPGLIYEYFRDQHNIDNLKQYESILCVSDDGIIHEILNYLDEQPDLIIGSIQSGSVNALLVNIYYLQNEQNTIQHHMFQLQKGITRDIDLFRIQMVDQSVLCFISICYGIISDIDIMSEWLRYLDTFRFDLIRFIRLLSIILIESRLERVGIRYRDTLSI